MTNKPMTDKFMREWLKKNRNATSVAIGQSNKMVYIRVGNDTIRLGNTATVKSMIQKEMSNAK